LKVSFYIGSGDHDTDSKPPYSLYVVNTIGDK